MTRFIQMKLGLLFIPACLFVATSASAQADECHEDTDCDDGQVCQKATYVNGCAATPDEPATACDTEPHVAEVGTCVTPPTPCDDDDDCGEYLSCVGAATDGDCAIDSAGNTYCSEPDQAEAKYCGIASAACETSDECPREFECVAVEFCFVDCAEGATECACAEPERKACQPKQIACEETADCPSDWSCLGTTTRSCQGGGTDAAGSGADGAGSGESSRPEPVAPEDEACTEEPSVGTCYPNAWNGEVVYAQDGIAETGDDGAGSASDPNFAEAEGARAGGGCSVADGPGRPAATWALGLLLAWPLLRRRRAA